jgi:hypothetical protein
LVPRKQDPMIVISEKIAPPRRNQIFNDYPAEDASIKRSLDEEDRWVKQFIDNLAGLVRKIGKGR